MHRADASRTLPRSLRAGRYIVVFRRMTLPLIGPSPATGAVLAWSRALGEFRATITSADNLPGLTQTVPLAIHQPELESPG